jgi:hypothetical protein
MNGMGCHLSGHHVTTEYYHPAAQIESRIRDARLFSKRAAICHPRDRMKVKLQANSLNCYAFDIRDVKTLQMMILLCRVNSTSNGEGLYLGIKGTVTSLEPGMGKTDVRKPMVDGKCMDQWLV